MKIRKATHDDIPALMRLFECAKGIMCASGNVHQWGSGYPSPEVVCADIDAGVCYVVCGDKSGAIEATMSFIPGSDPTYTIIEDGAWLDDAPYYVIHRIAVAAPGKGYARRLLDWAFERCPSVRIDTHRDNVIMHHILSNYGFKRCGVIRLANGDPRDAYQKSTENRVQRTEYREQMTDESLCQASESQVYLSFYSERSQGSSPRSGVKDDRAKFT